jgi:hypothetical protein
MGATGHKNGKRLILQGIFDGAAQATGKKCQVSLQVFVVILITNAVMALPRPIREVSGFFPWVSGFFTVIFVVWVIFARSV